jgi:O-antigen ligase
VRADRILEIGLVILLFAAVLAFGGTERFLFAFVQVGFFLLALLLVFSVRAGQEGPALPLLGPLLLIVYVLGQFFLGGRSYVTGEHLLRWLAYCTAFYVSAYVARDREARKRLVWALILLGCFEALYGLVQYLTGWQKIFTYTKVFYREDATGTYINRNHFAGLLEMILPLGLSLVLHAVERFRLWGEGTLESLGHDRGQVPRAFLSFSIVLLLFLGILFSRSRMGMLSALAGVATVSLLWASVSWRRRTAIVVLGAFLLGAVALGVWLGLEPVIQRYETVRQDSLGRTAIWKDTLELIKARPLLGSGLGTFAERYTRHQTVALTGYVDHAHNDYLEFTAELGLLGAGLLFGVLGCALARIVAGFYRSERGRSRFLLLGCIGGSSAIFLHSLADFNLQIPANALVFVTLLGLGWTASGAIAESKIRQETPD